MSRIRSTLEIKIGDEVRDLAITFDLIDRVRQVVEWERLAIEMSNPDKPNPNFTGMAKFLAINLAAAGFKDIEPEDLYEEMISSRENEQGFIALVSQIILAYQPKGSTKKKPQAKAKKK